MPLKLRFSVIAALMAFFIAGNLPAAADAPQDDKSAIQWHSYEKGMEKIKQSGKKGFLHFYTDWCSYCKLMDEKTFSDKNVADYMNGNFVAMRVNAEKEKQIAGKYRANRFPFNWFINEQSDPIGSQPGYIPPQQMVHMLKYVGTESYEKMKFSEFVESQEQ
jgi:thioredoxin-related protein